MSKLSEAELNVLRELLEFWEAQHGAEHVKKLIASHDALAAELAAATAENERLKEQWNDEVDYQRNKWSTHSSRGCPFCEVEDGVLKRQCKKCEEVTRLIRDLAAAQQRLDALAVDPAKREELIENLSKVSYERYWGSSWSNSSEGNRIPWRYAIRDALTATGNFSREAEIQMLQAVAKSAKNKLAALEKQLAELRGVDGDEELAKLYWAEVSDKVLEPWDKAGDYLKQLVIHGVRAVAAPLRLRIAELERERDAARARSDRAYRRAGKALRLSIRTSNILFDTEAAHDRLAAELATTKQALAAMTDERDRTRDMLRQAEASNKATQQALAAARGELDRVRKACEPFQGYCEFILADEEWSTNTDDSWFTRFGKVGYTMGDIRQFVAVLSQPAPAQPAASEPADNGPFIVEAYWPYEDGTERWTKANDGFDTRQAAEEWAQAALKSATWRVVPEPRKVDSEPTERWFVCPRCGCRSCTPDILERGTLPDMLRCTHKGCDWSGTWAEVEAAKVINEAADQQEPPHAE